MNNTPFIQLQKIAKRYDDGYLACSNININIDKGKFVTILGPSGCGKTTLLKMLAGFEMPSEGKIIVNGVDIKDLPIHMRPTATVFQDYALFPNMTIFENICYGLKIMRTELDNVPAKVYNQLAVAIQVNHGDLKSGTPEVADFLSAMADDLNTSNALAALFEKVKLANVELRKNPQNLQEISNIFASLNAMLDILGIKLDAPILTPELEKIYAEYLRLKSEKKFEESDKLRNVLMENKII